jgi:DNA processing protein
MPACDACLRRTWLLERISGYLEYERPRIEEVLCLDDAALLGVVAKVAGRRACDVEIPDEFGEFGSARADAERERADRAGVELICVCASDYPQRLRRLQGPPAVLHVLGGMDHFLDLARADPVAIVGTRRPTAYGTEVAQLLGRGASVSGLSVVSGMAIGVDAAAHRGALAAGGRTIAVLPGDVARPYPRANRQLHAQIVGSGVAVSELGAGGSVRKWTLIARNRIIAALAELTVVVQGRSRSGALTTARLAREVGCAVGAVPGSVMAAQSEGPHGLLRDGAALICQPQDLLDTVFGAGARRMLDPAVNGLRPDQQALLAAIRSGADTLAQLAAGDLAGGDVLALLAELELAGCLRRATGGRYVVTV